MAEAAEKQATEKPAAKSSTAVKATQLGLTIVELIPDQNLMLVRGPVPGPKGGTVEVRTDG